MLNNSGAQFKPVTLGLSPSFGFGDRIGLATPGHVAALHKARGNIEPIFPQQSIREMNRTNRTANSVMKDAIDGMVSSGWSGVTGADADHLKTKEDIDITHAAGFTFYTIDPSDHVDEHADSYEETTLRKKFTEVKDETTWVEKYIGKHIKLEGAEFTIDELSCIRCAVKYGRALNHAIELGEYIRSVNEAAKTDYEIELSVDETEQPTTLPEHYIFADICLKKNMKIVSLAPRYLGDFEKGVDYKGDILALEESLKLHAAIANALGPYKLSLHSGSDKLAMYPALARATQGKFHVKTAGTSYLEALRVVARHDERLFRSIIRFARERYDSEKATYHVSAEINKVPNEDLISNLKELEHTYLELWDRVPANKGFTKPGRQILHCTFGSTLLDQNLGPEIIGLLKNNEDTYTEVLCDHFTRHLKSLESGIL